MRLLPILFVNDNPIAAVSVLFDWHAYLGGQAKREISYLNNEG